MRTVRTVRTKYAEYAEYAGRRKKEKKMEKFRYELEKYKGKSTRHECPACKTKDSFARYVDEAGNYIDASVGRCNREDKCGYHLTPGEYYREKGESYQRTIHVEPKPLPPTDYIPEKMMVTSLTADNHFLTFLISQFGVQAVASILDTYYIGDTKDKKAIFWQVDEMGRVRTGKIMLYNPDTGRRVKNVPGSFGWVHRHIKKDYQLEQCLFGLHLIHRGKPIAIVESEKSAILASLTIPNYVWMATGGKQNYRLMEAVKGRDVTLFPDLGAFDDWQAHANKYGFRVSGLLEDIATTEDRENGLDIADYIINELNSNYYERKIS